MAQLIMRWKNDGINVTAPKIPENVTLNNFNEIPNALREWSEIVSYMGMEQSKEIIEDISYYEKTMLSHKNFSPESLFILSVNNIPAATITVICNNDTKEGYIHMVACKPQFRGKGLGTLLNAVALWALKKEGMQTAYLTTDDWRIPAIKSYLRAGFTPDLDTEGDFKNRWNEIYKIINMNSI